MDRIAIYFERLRRALSFRFRLGYPWRVAWAKAGYYDGRLSGPILPALRDEHADVSRCGAHTDIH